MKYYKPLIILAIILCFSLGHPLHAANRPTKATKQTAARLEKEKHNRPRKKASQTEVAPRHRKKLTILLARNWWHTIRKGNIAYLQILWRNYKVDVNKPKNDIHGTTSAHYAIANGQLTILRYLVEVCNADIDQKNNSGWTLLHEAAYQGYLPIVRYLLLVLHVDVNQMDHSGNTALHWATRSGKIFVVKYLVEEANANKYIKNNVKKMPCEVAADWKYYHIEDFLHDDMLIEQDVEYSAMCIGHDMDQKRYHQL